MAEIILSTRNNADQTLQFMSKEIVASIVEKIVSLKSQQVFLHADWSEPPEYSKWLIDTLIDQFIKVTICTCSVESLSLIRKNFNPNAQIELCLPKDADISEVPPEIHGLNFFLPIDTVSEDGSLYESIIAGIPSGAEVMLGINWTSRLSGPEPIEEEVYAAWANTTVSLIDKISDKKNQTKMACGLKLCMFTKDQLGHLPSRLISWPITHCTPSFFFRVDGSLQPCMRLNLEKGPSFNYQSDLIEASMAFEDWKAPFLGHCMESDNLSCRSLKTQCCATGCPHHTVAEWQTS